MIRFQGSVVYPSARRVSSLYLIMRGPSTELRVFYGTPGADGSIEAGYDRRGGTSPCMSWGLLSQHGSNKSRLTHDQRAGELS